MLRRAPLEGGLRAASVAVPTAGLGFLPGVCGGVSWIPAVAFAPSAQQLSLYHVCGIKLGMTSAHPYPAIL